MQIIMITSDAPKYQNCVEPFMYLWQRHFTNRIPSELNGVKIDKVVCGFSEPPVDFDKYGWRFHSIGNGADYPANKWSDALMHVLENVAQPQFMLMLEDYWLTKDADVLGINYLFSYAKQYEYLLKADITTDRLYSSSGNVDYGKLEHLELIRSLPGTDYQMSLWGGIWNRDTMKRFIIPGERAQEIETEGTSRVNAVGDSVLVIGTRQAPLLHANVYWSAFGDKPQYKDPYSDRYAVNEQYLKDMRREGIWKLQIN